MKKSLLIATAIVLSAASASALAARPTSIVFAGKAQSAEGSEYANYAVKCSNGKSLPLTAWDNRRKWCVGESASENCHRKQIKAAKAACKAG